jgi:hypothetical protein
MPAYLIVLEREIPGYSMKMDGSALSHSSEQLEELAKKAKVKSLMEFFRAAPEHLEAFVEDHGVDPTDARAKWPDELWYGAEDGLATIRALQSQVSSLKPKVRAAVERDLSDFASDLEAARAFDVRWHLAIDF